MSALLVFYLFGALAVGLAQAVLVLQGRRPWTRGIGVGLGVVYALIVMVFWPCTIYGWCRS